MIPIYIPVFNNPTYTRNMVRQLNELEYENIVIIDNASSFPPMVEMLAEMEKQIKIIRLPENRGPHFIIRDVSFYNELPNFFCLTDPDIEFSNEMTHNFLNILKDISIEHSAGKVGLALKIPDEEELSEKFINLDGKRWRVIDWEQQFWRERIGKTDAGDEIYSTTIDTTFALYNKKYFDINDRYKGLRVAGRFTSKHLGSYKKSIVPQAELDFYRKNSRYSYFIGNLDKEVNPIFEMNIHEYTKMVEEIDSIRHNNLILGQKNLELDKKIQNFYNSKSWRLISFIKRILGK